MKNVHILIIVLLALNFPLHTQAALIELSEHDIREAREFAALHKQNTGIVLNNTYSIGADELFTERVIIRTKWHKLALLYMVKAPGTELNNEEKEAVLGDPNIQIDIILYGHTLGFAEDYKALITQDAMRLEPQKMHADHFQMAQHAHNIYSGFPAYTATLRTYFNPASIDVSKPFTLILIHGGHEKSFTIDLQNFK